MSLAVFVMSGMSGSVPHRRVNAGCVESLREQIAVGSSDRGRVVQRLVVANPLVESLLNQRVFVELAKHLGHRRAGHVAGNAEGSELTERPQPPVPLDERFSPCAGPRGPRVVQGAFPAQPGDGCVDLSPVECATPEPRPHLRFGELAPRKPLQTGDIGVCHPTSLPRRVARPVQTGPDAR